MSAPTKLSDLVEVFDRNIDVYRSGNYTETNVRVAFIDPFFELLGWDVHNKKGYAENFKDVIHEDAIKIGGATKAPDYCFRIGGTRMFFVEAKKPAIDIKQDIQPAFQLRRYAWSAKLPLSILTDFEEFAVYDCRVKPDKNDKASNARVKYLNYKEYCDKWDDIYSIFSREAVLQGAFNKYIESTKVKKGTTEVDTAFLKEIEAWRELLAKNIALRNPQLTTRELNYAVQKSIDRIIFLRMCEDRGIEDYGRLMTLLNGSNVYKRLAHFFDQADQRYNSGLFHFHKEKDRHEVPDEFTLLLSIDDTVLKKILRNLYYPDCPYEFSVLPAEILGNVYEQFLGKVIRLTSGHQAKIEDKPEVKKAGGVYYTPKYIVDYIVENTIGNLLEGCKAPTEASKLKICDPACGSGSFLIVAYQYLLDWHIKWYTENDPGKWAAKKAPPIFQARNGEWKLTTSEKKRILLNTIYGVDIDSQAVEVTKLSLLLKVLEGENQDTLESQLKLFRERALPDLSDNIKCGNSLIGPDFYENEQMELLSDEERYKINVFDWDTGFPLVFNIKNPGFDAVIGNPPYVRIQTLDRNHVNYFNSKYHNIVSGSYDLYLLFIYKSLSILSKTGVFGMILPNKFFTAKYGTGIRDFLTKNNYLHLLVDFTANQIFESVSTYTCLLFLSKIPNNILKYLSFNLGEEYIINLNEKKKTFYTSNNINSSPWLFHGNDTQKVIEKISKYGLRLSDVTKKIFKGSSTGDDSVYILELIRAGKTTSILYSQSLKSNVELENRMLKNFVYGTDIRKYHISESNHKLLFPYKKLINKTSLYTIKELSELYPLTYEYLKANESLLKKRKIDISRNVFYKYSAARSLDEYDQTKILVPDILVSNRLSIDCNNTYHGPAIHSIILKEPESSVFYLTLLNSNIFWYFICNTSTALRGNAFRLTPLYLNPFPIPNYLNTNSYDLLVKYGYKMLDLYNKAGSIKTEYENSQILTQINATDNLINKHVYELYGLTEDEIKIVEEATK